jgi:ribonuclease HI
MRSTAQSHREKENTMQTPAHYLLSVDCQVDAGRGRWQFRLGDLDGSVALEAEDREWLDDDDSPERLELLALVRGLEALDEPSTVTVVGASSHVRRGLLSGLEAWRADDFHWEYFGELVPVPHADLWRRVDHALRFHTIEVRHKMPTLNRSHFGQRTVFSGRLTA